MLIPGLSQPENTGIKQSNWELLEPRGSEWNKMSRPLLTNLGIMSDWVITPKYMHLSHQGAARNNIEIWRSSARKCLVERSTRYDPQVIWIWRISRGQLQEGEKREKLAECVWAPARVRARGFWQKVAGFTNKFIYCLEGESKKVNIKAIIAALGGGGVLLDLADAPSDSAGEAAFLPFVNSSDEKKIFFDILLARLQVLPVHLRPCLFGAANIRGDVRLKYILSQAKWWQKVVKMSEYRIYSLRGCPHKSSRPGQCSSIIDIVTNKTAFPAL